MRIAAACIALLVSVVCVGQNVRTLAPPLDDFSSNKPSNSPTSSSGTDYRIGSDDKLDVTVFEIMELAATPRVSASGKISLGPIGSLQAGGLTPQELERAIEKALQDKELVNEPRVTVTVIEYASQPVSIMGAVKMPNIYQVKGEKTLSSMIAQAQGLDPMNVGSTIQVIRAPKPGVEREVININVDEFQRGNIALDVPIYANDRINVFAAESVFVMGEVKQPGEFVLKNGMALTVLKAVTRAGDLTKEAKKKESRIIRVHRDGTREEIKLDIDKMKEGKVDDIELMANDILLIPPNRVKAALNRTVESTIGVVSGRLIYRF
jgi:polysaccharide biosynthesis/export protein